MAQPTSTRTTTSDSNDWTIVSTLARWLSTAVSVGLKAVLALKAKNR